MAASRAGSASCAVLVRRVLSPGALALTRVRKVVGRHVETELPDDAFEGGAPRRDARVGCREALRDEDLIVVGARHRERLADNERRLRPVRFRQDAADHARRATRQLDAHDQEREPRPNDGDLAPELHEVSLSPPRRRGALGKRH